MTSVEVALFLGTALSPLHAGLGVRASPQQLSLAHSSLVVGVAAGFLPAGPWPAPSQHTAGGPAFHCNVHPSPRVLVLGGGGQF